MEARLDLTVAIPTYNGASRLPLVLEHLRSQHTPSLTWEVLVVDNNSTDDTPAVMASYQSHWRADVPLRYCFEPQQGIAFARQRAIEHAQGEWVGFIDDDNLPDPHWVQAAVAFGRAYPAIGAIGSRIEGQFEEDPPAALRPMLYYLALVNRGTTPSPYQPRRHGLPPGAGLVVRRQAWLDSVPTRLVLSGRVGQSMVCGEDWEALIHLHQHGWQIWHNPAMRLVHLIPPNRLEPAYFKALVRGVGLGRYHFRMLLLPGWLRFPGFWLYLLNDLKRLLVHLFHSRDRLSTDLFAQCEAERLWATLISPLYVWNRQLHHLWSQSLSSSPSTTGNTPLPKASNPS